MTSEVKNYIELSDILKMRFECRSCEAALELRLDEIKKGKLTRCPMCGDGWSAFQGKDSIWHDNEPVFTGLAQAIKNADELSSNGVIGFILKLEIKSS